MIKIARIYNYSGRDYKILIDRMWPRGIKKSSIDLWLKDVAPSKSIILNYHKTKDYEAFKQEYTKELKTNPKVDELISLIKSKNCVLLYSSSLLNNNATILKEYLEKK